MDQDLSGRKFVQIPFEYNEGGAGGVHDGDRESVLIDEVFCNQHLLKIIYRPTVANVAQEVWFYSL